MEDGNWEVNKKDVEGTLTKGLILFIGCSGNGSDRLDFFRCTCLFRIEIVR